MIKIQILTHCEYCGGKAYLPAGEAVSNSGERYQRYVPCAQCEGSGRGTKWISLQDFIPLLKMASCPHEHNSFRGGHHFSAGEVWDDIVEVCNDCGANLEEQSSYFDHDFQDVADLL